MNLFAPIAVLALITGDAPAPPDLAQHFAGIDGAFVLYDTKKQRYYRYNEKRCAERFSPCSTFKIPNALIALETGIVPDESFTLKWDSVKTPRQNLASPAWARDHDLRSAMRYSVVWYFQEVARRVGAPNYKKYLQRFNYGNQDIAGGSDRFWLSSSLQISANEQIKFLKKFYAGKLGLSQRTTEVVKSIIVLEQTAQYKLSGKTGAGSQANGKMLGWLVGYVEAHDNVYFYALNFDGETFPAVSERRLILVKALLKELEVIP